MYRNDFLINELENTLYELRDIMYNKLFQKDFVDLEKSIEIVKQKHINQLYIVDVKIQNFVRLLYEIYKNFRDSMNNNEAIISSFRDCLLPVFIDIGYSKISNTRFFRELKMAIQKCTKE